MLGTFGTIVYEGPHMISQTQSNYLVLSVESDTAVANSRTMTVIPLFPRALGTVDPP